jgi:SAM-dependent methyltransferase
MIAEADRRALEAGVSAWVKHQHADATVLPFEPDHFDSSRSERLFQHLVHPEKALSEMARVTRRDGWIVVLDTDWMSVSFDTTEFEIEQRLKQFRVEHFLNNALAGRQLYGLFKRLNLSDIAVEMCPIYVTDPAAGRQGATMDELEQQALAAGCVTADELQGWRNSEEIAAAEGVYFGSCNQVTVAGRKR